MMHNLETNSNIPTFILKLWKLVGDETSNNLISWNRSGQSFVIHDQSRFAKELLPLYFKHSNMASFIRQLNMYGFRKLSNIDAGGLRSEGDEVEFFHQFFNLENEDQLAMIKRKMPTNRPVSSIVKVDELHDIIGDVESIRGRQDSVDSLLNQMKNENEALWREVAILRQKHMKQQQVVEKLLNFLVSIVRNGVIPAGIKRKQAPLLIDSGGKSVGSNLKLMKTSSSSSTADNIRYSHSPMAQGPIIHDITELDDALNDVTLDLNFGEGNSGENNAQQQQQQQTQEQQPQYSSSSAVIVNSPMSILSDHSAKANEANQQLVPAADNSIVAIGDIPDSLFDYNLNDDQADVSSLNSILNTPCISINDSPFNINNIGDTSGVDGTGDNNTNTTTTINPCDNNTAGSSNDTNTNNTYVANPTTDLALTKPTSNTLLFDSNEPLSSDVFNDHLDGIDTELGWLQDQLYDNDFQLDPAKLLELFQSDQQLLPVDESNNSVEQQQQLKALMSDPNAGPGAGGGAGGENSTLMPE